MTPTKLATRIRDLRYHTRADPYDLFVAETMRAIGIPLSDEPPAAEVMEHVRPLVQDYADLVNAGDPFEDLLGPVYMEYTGGAQAFAGQFFTPPDMCDVQVAVMLGGWQPGPPPSGDLWTVYEPAAGSGAMLLSLWRTLLRRHGPEVLRSWGAVAWDLDLVVARTVAIQMIATMARFGWGLGELRIVHGNTLTQERFSTVLHAVARPGRRPVEVMPPAGVGSQLDFFVGRELVGVGHG